MAPLRIGWVRAAELARLPSFDPAVRADLVRRRSARREVFAAWQGGQPLGYARVLWLPGGSPYLAWIFVVGGHRRKGVGRALLGFLASDPRAGRAGRIHSACAPGDRRAWAWHKAVGFLRGPPPQGLPPCEGSGVHWVKAVARPSGPTTGAARRTRQA